MLQTRRRSSNSFESRDVWMAATTLVSQVSEITPGAICADFCTVCDMSIAEFATPLSVTDAAKRGLPRLVADAEAGASVVVERRGVPAAVVVGIERMQAILRREDDLRSAALVLTRAATDSGNRSSLDEVISAFGFDRAELEAELDAELRASDV